MPEAASEEEARQSATTHAYWNEAVGRPPGGKGGTQTVGMRGLLEEMDGAQRVVLLGGPGAAWRDMYGGDNAREAAHRAKMVVIGEEKGLQVGSRVRRGMSMCTGIALDVCVLGICRSEYVTIWLSFTRRRRFSVLVIDL